MTPEVIAYVGLGSNLDGPAQRLERALADLDGLPDTRLAGASRRYVSPPMGPADQPHYVNAVARLATRLDAHALLAALQAIEEAHGRVRDPAVRWGPRTLDLDILLYGREQIADERLTVPHPGVHQRPFVFVPLLELEPAIHVPGVGSLAAAVAHADRQGLVVLE